MAHTFNIKIANDLPAALKHVESVLCSGGGSFTGTTESGSFSGSTPLGQIKGQYSSVAPDEVCIMITDKPFLLPHSTIESEIRKYFLNV